MTPLLPSAGYSLGRRLIDQEQTGVKSQHIAMDEQHALAFVDRAAARHACHTEPRIERSNP